MPIVASMPMWAAWMPVSVSSLCRLIAQLRKDFDPSDLVLLHMANLGVVNACGDAAPDAWRRVVALMIQSFEAPARAPLPASPAHDDLYRAMLRALPAGDTVTRKPAPNS